MPEDVKLLCGISLNNLLQVGRQLLDNGLVINYQSLFLNLIFEKLCQAHNAFLNRDWFHFSILVFNFYVELSWFESRLSYKNLNFLLLLVDNLSGQRAIVVEAEES
jgi:hypothetical protein